MASLQVSGMKMRNLLFGVILGLLAVVHSTPVSTVTQIPTATEDDFFHEAVTDGFLVDHYFLTSLTTESPKRNVTVPASPQPSTELTDIDMIEGSGSEYNTISVFPGLEGKQYTTTTQSVSHAQSSTSTDDPRTDSSTAQSPQSGFIPSSVPNEDQSSFTPDHSAVSQTTDPAVTSSDLPGSEFGSGDEDLPRFSTTRSSMTSISNTETSSASSTPEAPKMFDSNDGSAMGSDFGSGSGMISFSTATIKEKGRRFQIPLTEVSESQKKEVINPAAPQNTEQSTPGWIIIVGFIVGVAALVMLCVAIATRDKWNKPKQASPLDIRSNSNQQREQEETFLHKDNPRENGKAAEYTVIPLEELPEKYSSH